MVHKRGRQLLSNLVSVPPPPPLSPCPVSSSGWSQCLPPPPVSSIPLFLGRALSLSLGPREDYD